MRSAQEAVHNQNLGRCSTPATYRCISERFKETAGQLEYNEYKAALRKKVGVIARHRSKHSGAKQPRKPKWLPAYYQQSQGYHPSYFPAQK
jgi:hypothetical protein